MSTVATTKLSSKGQVVIPEDIREKLGLKTGDQFVVIGQGDAVILKVLSAPPISEFQPLLKQAKKEAKAAGLKPIDLENFIKKARSKK